MHELINIKDYDFEGYDDFKIQQTLSRIAEFKKDAEIVWSEWIKEGMAPFPNTQSIDFEFYSASKEGSHAFSKVITRLNYEFDLKPKRTLLIFKGWEIKVSINDSWTLTKLQQMIENIGLLARKYNVSIEGFGALIKKQ